MKLMLTACALMIAVAGAADARDRPGTPNDVTMVPQSPTEVLLGWHDTDFDFVSYEFEFTKNMQPYDPWNTVSGNASPDVTNYSYDGSGKKKYMGNKDDNQFLMVGNLEPIHHYCFRIWARDENDVRSEIPSAWACADTPAYAPAAPLDLNAVTRARDHGAALTWNSPEQSGYRPVEHFDIERRSTKGTDEPIIAEGRIAGPNGDQSSSAQLSLSYVSSDLTDPTGEEFRVCSVNSGGRTCGPFVGVSVDQSFISAAVGDNRIPTIQHRVASETKSSSAVADIANPQRDLGNYATAEIMRATTDGRPPASRSGLDRYASATIMHKSSDGPIVGEPGGYAGPAPDMTGVFDSDFGTLVLSKKDGEYKYKDGRVSIAKIWGDFMDGTWSQSESGQKCADGTYHGTFHFQFSKDGFTGQYGYCEGPTSAGPWNGKRPR